MAQVNRAELAEILGVSLPTITSKVSKGMPFEQRGGRGREWTFDTAAVFEWEKEQAIINATGDLSSVTDDELKRRKLAAETTNHAPRDELATAARHRHREVLS